MACSECFAKRGHAKTCKLRYQPRKADAQPSNRTLFAAGLKCPCVLAERPVSPCVDCWHFHDGPVCVNCGSGSQKVARERKGFLNRIRELENEAGVLRAELVAARLPVLNDGKGGDVQCM